MNAVAETKEDHGLEQAKAQFSHISELMHRWSVSNEIDETEAVEQEIREHPLSVLVRGNWHEPGTADSEPGEYEILLCTGGPAVRIRGDLNEHSEPISAFLSYQDWGTPWTHYLPKNKNAEKIMLNYASRFWFGA